MVHTYSMYVHTYYGTIIDVFNPLQQIKYLVLILSMRPTMKCFRILIELLERILTGVFQTDNWGHVPNHNGHSIYVCNTVDIHTVLTA
jgi:hypothetical protein